MKRRKRVKGYCGKEFVQSEYMHHGDIRMECSNDSNFWFRCLYESKEQLEKDCREVCRGCQESPW